MIIKKKKSASNLGNVSESSQESIQDMAVPAGGNAAPGEDEFENINFSQREERRRGNRRRGYRRIEDRKLISRAQEEAITIKENASKEGFQKGLEMARSEIERIKKSIFDISDVRKTVYDDISGEILEISLAIAEKIINKEISSDKSIILSMITNALNDCAKHESKVTIKVSNEDFDFVKKSIPALSGSLSEEVRINVVPLNELSENSVIIETGNGLMDISCQTQLKVLQEMFKAI